MKKLLSIVTCSIFILLAFSVNSTCYATPSELTSEQIQSEKISLELLKDKLTMSGQITDILITSLKLPKSNEVTEKKIINDLSNTNDTLSYLLTVQIPIPDTTMERKLNYIKTFSILDEVCITEKELTQEIINYRKDRTQDNLQKCHDTALEISKKIANLQETFGSL